MKSALCLISSGIDSPVAAAMMMDKLNISFIHFDNQPFTTSTPREKVIKQLEQLSNKYQKELKLYIVAHGKNQANYMKNADRRFQCIFCRRMMFRISEKVANDEKIDFLLTGENIGQVASQTLQNMITEDKVIDIEILRPILANDKNDTIKLGRELNTFDISIEKDVCCFAVPKNPATKARPDQLEFQEKKIDVDALIDSAINSKEMIIIKPSI